MNKLLVLAGLLLVAPTLLPAQLRLLVAGNTYNATPAFYEALGTRIDVPGDPVAVLLAGDYFPVCTEAMLAYGAGGESDAAAFPTLAPLLQLIRDHPRTQFYLLPGDRDWDKSGRNGLACVQALESYLENQNLDNLHWPLNKGCPGPETVELSPTVRLLMLNTQWWNHPFEKPIPADAECDFAEPTIAFDEIVSTIDEHLDQNIIFAGHYPPVSQGRYGGKFPLRDHFLPPVAGSFALSYRQNVGTPEELTNVRFAELADKLKDYNSQFEGLLFIGAQDQSQQLLRFGRNYIVNAGAAGPGAWVARHKPALHTSRAPGFTELRFATDGSVDYRYVTANPGEWTTRLYRSPCEESGGELPRNPAYPPCPTDTVASPEVVPPATPTVQLAAGPQYRRSALGEWFLGRHYRDVWTTEVEVPVLRLSEVSGGLQPVREGGGRQTTSLVLQAPGGESYAFRSVDKDPSGTFSYELRNTLIGDAVRDQTSSGHPYGGVIVAPLLEEIDILHATPTLYSLAPDPLLGDYNATFGNMLGTLEIRPQGDSRKQSREGTFGADEVLKSFELFRGRFDDQEVRIDDAEFVRARLFDLLIGDWSKHEDNWKWARYEEGGVDRIRPIPRDRDNAFSRLDGLFPWLASRRWAVPNLENFGYGQPDIRSLTFQARHMDRLLLSGVSRETYREQAAMVQSALTDEVLARAVAQVPDPVSDGPQSEKYRREQAILLEKLKRRRDDLPAYADAYYALHARIVDVVGTNDEEAFLLEALPDGRLTVTVIDLKGKSEGQVLYQRTFLPGETEEVRVYGLGDDDTFATRGEVGDEIRVRLIGGKGDDAFNAGHPNDYPEKVFVYDDQDAAEPDVAVPGLKFVKSWRDELYYYDRTAFKYNTLTPLASAGFNTYNGAQLGVGLTYTRRSFTRRDFSTRYRFFAQASSLGNAALDASVEFGEVLRYADLVLASRLGRPDLYNFFYGLGNTSVQDPNLDRNVYYLVSLQHFSVEGALRRRFAGRSFVSLSTGYQNNKTTDREGTILDRPDRLYGDGDLVFAYLEPEMVVDLRDHPIFPSKGVMLEAGHKQAYGKDEAANFGVSRIAAEIHFSTRRFPISLSFRTGYASSSGKAPFYELPSLGRQNGLRGFQRHRFVGDGYFFYNTEFRTPLALIRSRIAPFAIGIRAFYDRGKILQDGEEPSDYHSAYGGGFYVIPLSRSFTVSMLLGFSEEETGLVQLGVGTNF
ncbi:BamA/TamA family outer membrane protein [Neolewinella litorea]|nr:BamA/TamA family outer membrane protein [Neolewinella litorea]